MAGLVGNRFHPARVPWLGAFLVLTIAAERLELSRLRRPDPLARATFLGASAIIVLGALVSLGSFAVGVRVAVRGSSRSGSGSWPTTSRAGPSDRADSRAS